jgi:hypothetical protein
LTSIQPVTAGEAGHVQPSTALSNDLSKGQQCTADNMNVTFSDYSQFACEGKREFEIELARKMKDAKELVQDELDSKRSD